MILSLANPSRWIKKSHIPLLLVFLVFCLWYQPWSALPHSAPQIPLVHKYVDSGEGEGGRWYIPPSWIARASNHTASGSPPSTKPRTVLEAAKLSLELALRNKQYVKHTNIPLIIHQTWKNFDSSSWSELVQSSIEEWLNTATKAGGASDHPEMAYILWDDAGSEQFIKEYEPVLWNGYSKLPQMVEKTDSFRVAVLKWFGGVYADVDTRPLQHPYDWVQDSDLSDWTDVQHSATYSVYAPKEKSYIPPQSSAQDYKDLLTKYAPSEGAVSAIYGIEADNPVGTDDYWRMGYIFCVQLSNWAFAMAPQNPTAASYVERLTETIDQNATRLQELDPLELTGPGPLVRAVRGHCEAATPDFDWNALSGIKDPKGGRGKVAAGDVLILPITGFSPGRGVFHNMGSEPLGHPNARLFHSAAGSWRDSSIRVEVGKLCRTFLGRCKDWSKVA